MKIIQAETLGAKTWRVLMIMAPGERLGICWQFGVALANANNGDLLAAVVIPNARGNALNQAQAAIHRIHQASPPKNGIHPLIVEDAQNGREIERLVQETGANLLLVQADGPVWHNSLNNVSCAVAVVRGDNSVKDAHLNGSQRILIPTSSGPNTAHALRLLLPLTVKNELTALYVANASQGPNQEALGWSRLREALKFAGASETIKSKVISRDSIIEGIVEEASDYDMVLLGASQESRFDKALFGDIPGAVVRFSKTPVIILREPKSRLGNLVSNFAWRLQKLVPRMRLSERTEAYVRIRRSARPDTQFFILIALSAMIAALGLIINSPAVVIGAMLVAPLMSPIVGSGLAIVLGDTRFLRLSLGAVVRGVLLAIAVGALSGLLHLDKPLTSELLARTEPTLLDLAIALFSGMAGAYALSNSDAAGALPGVAIAAALVPPLATVGISLTTGHEREALGALLLFTTNFVAISSATALVFLTLGFRPKVSRRERHSTRARSVRIAMMLLVIIAGLLTTTTYRLAQASNIENHIRSVIYQSVAEIADAQLVSLSIDGDTTNENAPLQMDLVARSTETIPHETVIELQEYIGIKLQREVGLTLTVILVTELDPVVPPTLTPTPTSTNTFTPGPTPTPGPSRTPLPTATVPAAVLPGSTETITPSATSVDTAVPPEQSQPTAEPAASSTPKPQPSKTSTPGATSTNTPAATALPTVTETAVPTAETSPTAPATATTPPTPGPTMTVEGVSTEDATPADLPTQESSSATASPTSSN
jgi:uncharacterized hydrophobic protein (TIGR00271 family)